MTWQSGARYEGNFVDNHMQGIGKFITKKGTIYEGKFHADKIKEGKSISLAGSTYEGTWNDNFLPDG